MSSTHNTDLTDYPETELMPGVYMTDFRQLQQQATNNNTSNNVQTHDNTPTDIEQLDFEIDELQNSIKHLHSSNTELQQFIEKEPTLNSDNSLSDAISENIVIIQRKQGELELYQKLRAELNQHVSDTVKEQKSNDGVYL